MYMKFQGPFPVCLLMLFSFALKSEKSQLHINDRAGLQRRVHAGKQVIVRKLCS